MATFKRYNLLLITDIRGYFPIIIITFVYKTLLVNPHNRRKVMCLLA